MKSIISTLILLLAFTAIVQSQTTQTVRGMIIDKESQFPLIGVNISLVSLDGTQYGTTTEIDGTFRFDEVNLGRQSINCSYLGYQPIILNDIILDAGKETILNLEMEEAFVEIDEVVITARRNGEVTNEMATVSAREFSVAETNRYAGSRGEPARMASNFAGVQGADDSRNDVVVRGNSPTGVLWRLEGINIPNPNHFSIPGTGGGSVTILNNKFLKNSDFYTGAFPAEYGNGVAGVFDLKMRNGNNENHEVSAQLGFLGTELMIEGPLSKESKASYLATYRYSSLQLFQGLGIDVGTDAIPRYQDAAFRLNFPRKNGGNIALFGIGGKSNIDILISDEVAPSSETLIFGSNDRDQYFGSEMGVVGLTYSQPLSTESYFKVTLSAAQSSISAQHEYIDRQVVDGIFVYNALVPILDYTFTENKYSVYLNYVRKLNNKGSLKVGLNADLLQGDYMDIGKTVNLPQTPSDTLSFSPWQLRWSSRDAAPLIQPYAQYKHRFTDRLSGVVGLTALYFGINDQSFSPFEPRLGLSYDLNEKEKLGLGLGLHSQIQSPYLYYYLGNTELTSSIIEPLNIDNIGLMKSAHFVASYDRVVGKVGRLKAETYFQWLYDLPVGADGGSFSLINAGSGFSRLFPDLLTTGGNGRNIGVELTLERFFSGGYYYLVTGSLFDAKYRTLDSTWRNTSFNGKYAVNGLFAKEWTFKGKNSLNLGVKTTFVGGGWYGDVDEEESQKQQQVVYRDETVNTLRFAPYMRQDIRLAYKINSQKLTHELAIDIVNIFDRRNILTLTYSPDHPEGPIVEEYQLGRLPLFYYRIDF